MTEGLGLGANSLLVVPRGYVYRASALEARVNRPKTTVTGIVNCSNLSPDGSCAKPSYPGVEPVRELVLNLMRMQNKVGVRRLLTHDKPPR
jgi:hypothetical protein